MDICPLSYRFIDVQIEKAIAINDKLLAEESTS
jgi:hypothetical protein